MATPKVLERQYESLVVVLKPDMANVILLLVLISWILVVTSVTALGAFVLWITSVRLDFTVSNTFYCFFALNGFTGLIVHAVFVKRLGKRELLVGRGILSPAGASFFGWFCFVVGLLAFTVSCVRIDYSGLVSSLIMLGFSFAVLVPSVAQAQIRERGMVVGAFDVVRWSFIEWWEWCDGNVNGISIKAQREHGRRRCRVFNVPIGMKEQLDGALQLHVHSRQGKPDDFPVSSDTARVEESRD